jgi:hypothetical protein
MGAGDDRIDTSSSTCEADDDTLVDMPSDASGGDKHVPIAIRRGLDQRYFKVKLIDHFDILFRQNKIDWPSRTGLAVPTWYTEQPSK